MDRAIYRDWTLTETTNPNEDCETGGSVTMGVYIEPSGLDPVVAQGGGTGGNHAFYLSIPPSALISSAARLSESRTVCSLIAIAPVDGQYRPADQFVPIENVIHGTVRENYDLLIEHDLAIVSIAQVIEHRRRAEKLVRRAHKRGHLIATLAQLAHDMAADESGSSGDELHGGEQPYLPEIRPPEKCGASGASRSDPAKSGKRRVAPSPHLLLSGLRCRRRSPRPRR